MDPTIVAGCIGATAVLAPCAIAFFVAWGGVHATIDSLKARMASAEQELGALASISNDVSYIRGVLDGEARAARKTTTRGPRA